jgi:hypothetical protein
MFSDSFIECSCSIRVSFHILPIVTNKSAKSLDVFQRSWLWPFQDSSDFVLLQLSLFLTTCPKYSVSLMYYIQTRICYFSDLRLSRVSSQCSSRGFEKIMIINQLPDHIYDPHLEMLKLEGCDDALVQRLPLKCGVRRKQRHSSILAVYGSNMYRATQVRFANTCYRPFV